MTEASETRLYKSFSAVVLSLAISCCLFAPRHALADAGDTNALASATHDLCPAQIVMLGESNTHGDGHTEAFKAALVQKLVNECGFDSVFFEASHYEFINMAMALRSGHALSADQVLTAVGGPWKFDLEFQPLASFLAAKAQAGQILLGGIDDQLGLVGQDYANLQMVEQFTSLLPEQRRQDCKRNLHQRIYSDYTEASPYSNSDRDRINTCLADVKRAVGADEGIDQDSRTDRLEMVTAFQRWIARDFTTDTQNTMGRDQSMFQDFAWLMQRNPKHHKVILWAATVHIAKQRDPGWGDQTGKNLGSYVHEAYGDEAFSLGFSALAGTYRQGRKTVQDVPIPPADSIEKHTRKNDGTESVYIGPAHLKQLGTLAGEIFRHSYETLNWFTFLDGVVVFTVEHPPSGSRP